LYIIRSRDGSLYTGIAKDVKRRLKEHQDDAGKGAKYLRGKGPLKLVFQKKIGSMSLALQLEKKIKRLPKPKKEEIIQGSKINNSILHQIAPKISKIIEIRPTTPVIIGIQESEFSIQKKINSVVPTPKG